MYKLIKHRGLYNKDIKENTYTAIKNALLSDKYIGVEFDVRETIDNEFIIYHNATYNNKLISNLNYRELPKYIPRLKDILKINSNKLFLIEIKNITNFTKFINILNKHNNKNIYVMSFIKSLIDKINTTNRKYKIGILNYILNTNKEDKKYDFIGILNSILNINIISNLKDLEIFSYGNISIKDKLKYENVYYIVDN